MARDGSAADRARMEPPSSAKLVLSALTADVLAAADEATIRAWLVALRAGARARVRSPGTLRVYEAGLRSLARYLAERRMPGLLDATREHLVEWLIELRETRAPATVSLYLTAVRLFYRFLIEEGERRDDPTVRLAAPPPDSRLVEPFTREEVERLLATQDTRRLAGARNVAIFLTLLDTQLRRSECVALRLDAIDWRHGTIRVIGKGRKERLVRIGTAAQRAIASYLRIRARNPRLDGEALWVSGGGRPLTVSAIDYLCTQAGKRAGIHCHAHRFRHTGIQWMLDAGADRESVRVLAGHSGYATLARYTRTGDARRALAAHEQFSPADALRRKR